METHLLADIPAKAIIIKDGKILITKDKRWELPGGRMNVGEHPEETLHREVMEELGATVSILGLQDVFVRSDSNPVHVFIVYRCELTTDEPFKIDPKEVQDMRWIGADDDLAAIDFYPGYQAVLTKFFKSSELV